MFHTTAEVAQQLRTDPNAVRIMIRRGELKAVKKFRDRKRPTYLVSDADLARYIAEQAA